MNELQANRWVDPTGKRDPQFARELAVRRLMDARKSDASLLPVAPAKHGAPEDNSLEGRTIGYLASQRELSRIHSQWNTAYAVLIVIGIAVSAYLNGKTSVFWVPAAIAIVFGIWITGFLLGYQRRAQAAAPECHRLLDAASERAHKENPLAYSVSQSQVSSAYWAGRMDA